MGAVFFGVQIGDGFKVAIFSGVVLAGVIGAVAEAHHRLAFAFYPIVIVFVGAGHKVTEQHMLKGINFDGDGRGVLIGGGFDEAAQFPRGLVVEVVQLQFVFLG